MMLELILPDSGGPRRGDCCVSISGKFRRILLFKEAYAEICFHHGQDFEYVQFLVDREKPDRFWMRPAVKEACGSARIVRNPRNGTRTMSAAYLFKALGWESERSVGYPLMWDAENDAAVVITGTIPG